MAKSWASVLMLGPIDQRTRRRGACWGCPFGAECPGAAMELADDPIDDYFRDEAPAAPATSAPPVAPPPPPPARPAPPPAPQPAPTPPQSRPQKRARLSSMSFETADDPRRDERANEAQRRVLKLVREKRTCSTRARRGPASRLPPDSSLPPFRKQYGDKFNRAPLPSSRRRASLR